MKVIKKLMSGMFVLLMLIAAPLKGSAGIMPPNPPKSISKKDANNEVPPENQPKNSNWYNIDTRNLLNNAVEENIGKGIESFSEPLTVGQAVHTLAYVKIFLYDNHGNDNDFQNKRLELSSQEIKIMSNFEGRAISEYDIISREELMHLIIRFFNIKTDKVVFDPASLNNRILTPEEYLDFNTISNCYKQNVQQALTHGYALGTDSYKLLPRSYATINDLVVMTERAVSLHYSTHRLRITVAQIRSAFSKLNEDMQKIPVYIWTVLGLVFSFGGITVIKVIFPKNSA